MIEARPSRVERRARSDAMARSPMGETRHWQIGPRIRVGGTLGKIGQNVKIATGKALENPIVDGALTFIPGVGPGLAAAAGATGRALDTSNGGLHGLAGLGSLAAGGAEGYGAGKLAGGVQSLLGGLLHGGVPAGGAGAGAAGTDAAGAVPDSGGALQSIEHLLGNIPGGLEGILGKAGSFLGGNGGLNALGVAQGVNAALQQKQANDYAKNARGEVMQSYNERAPLRTQGVQSLQTAMRANPFATGVPQMPIAPRPQVQPLMGGY